MTDIGTLAVGTRVEVSDKGVRGVVAYIGTTEFASGAWVGIILDDPKGKNNGTVNGKSYFKCADNHGMFKRAQDLTVLPEQKPTKMRSFERLEGTPDAAGKARGSRLPVSGLRDIKETVGKKTPQSTPSGFRNNLAPSASRTDLGSKRPSFVETGFSESIVPQYIPGTPGSVITTPVMTPASSGNPGEDRFGALQLNESLKNEVKDLSEKLEALKAKRAGDAEKLRDLDRLRIQVETLNEFKAKVLESQASLQRDLNKAKQEARDAIEAREIHAEEMSDLSEAVEMATLDKEMAEEKAETLQMELDQAQEKIAELETELNAYKDEASGKVDPETGEVTKRQVKQLQDDNARYREALFKMRDASAHEKHQHQKAQKEVEELKHEAQDLQRTKERLEDRMIELESQVADLQELNDAALGAEEMLESLTEKNLNLEEKVNQLMEAVTDLEALQDINEQLQESAKETEVDLRNDLQHSQTEILEMRKQRQTLLELIADKEGTIFKFREHVKQLSEELAVLRRSSEEEAAKSMPGLTEALDFKKVFAETKAQTTAIDLELRRLEAREAMLHVQFLTSFMPEGFMKRGGDNDALLVLLLVPRLICKAELLLTQVKQKLIPVHLIDVDPSSDDIAASPDVEQYAFSMQMCFLLNSLLSELRRWNYALNTCTPADFLKYGILLPELSVQEKSVDFYLELIRKSQLDENISLAGLEKCIAAFQNFFNVHLSELYIEPASIVSGHCAATAAASDCVIVDANRLSFMLKKSEKETGIGLLLQDLKTIGESVRQIAKRTPRYLPDYPKQPPVSATLQDQILQDSGTLNKAVKALQEVCKQAIRHSDVLSSSGVEGLTGSKVEEFFNSALAQCDLSVDGGDGLHQTLKLWLTTVLMTMTDLAQVVNEAPKMSQEKPPAPVSLRAEAVKAELDLTRNLKIQLEDKEVTIKELKSVLTAKKDELSQAVIRKDLAEKKLSNLTKEHEMVVEKLERKLEDTKVLLDRKQREFDATLEHFQTDLQSLESENKEWKDKVRSFQKSTILANLDSMIASSSTSPLNTPSHTAVSSSTPVQESYQGLTSGPASVGLIDYTRFLQRENWRLRSEKSSETLRHMPPLLKNHNNMDVLKSLDKEFWSLKREWIKLLGESVKLAYDKTLSIARKEYYGEINELQKRELLEKMAALKDKINQELAKENSDSIIKSDLTTFCAAKSAEIADAAKKVGALRFTGWDKSKQSPKKIVLTQNQLNELHKLLSPF